MNKYEQKVERFVAEKRLLEQSQSVLVALSGGADSVYLLLTLLQLGYKCHAAHCNFHLRGEESNRDELFVTNLCAHLSVPLYKTNFDTLSYASQQGISIEMAARDLRYDFFSSLLKQHGISTLAVGHHQGDNAETLLLNLVRGTGIRGLSGIQPLRDMGDYKIVRPLLCLTHEEIVCSLQSVQQAWVEDSTNQHDDVGRNIVRLDILPQLERINPSSAQNIITTIDNLNEVQKVYENAIRTDIKRCAVSEGVLSIPELLASVSPISVLHEWLAGKGFNRTHERDILMAAQQGQSGKIIKDVLVDRSTLVLESAQHYAVAEDITIRTLPISEVKIERNPRIAYLDAKKIQGELTIRLVQPADSFQPFGMKGRKLLSDFMTNCKLNVFEKRHQLVVADASDIVWVVGLRSSEKYRVDEGTKTVVVLSI